MQNSARFVGNGFITKKISRYVEHVGEHTKNGNTISQLGCMTMKNHSSLCEYAFYGNECPDPDCRLEHPKLHVMQTEKKTHKQFDLSVWIDNWIGEFLIHQPESK